ncbi:MAG: DUF5674 family protein [bacterium]
MIHIIRQKATRQRIDEMQQEYSTLIKLAVDIQRNILAGGGRQENVWGANWIPATQTVEFEALINIRPKSSKIFQ